MLLLASAWILFADIHLINFRDYGVWPRCSPPQRSHSCYHTNLLPSLILFSLLEITNYLLGLACLFSSTMVLLMLLCQPSTLLDPVQPFGNTTYLLALTCLFSLTIVSLMLLSQRTALFDYI